MRDLEGARGDVDDATVATLRFASGAVATLAATSLLDAKHRAALHLFSRGLVLEVDETGAVVVDDGGRTERDRADRGPHAGRGPRVRRGGPRRAGGHPRAVRRGAAHATPRLRGRRVRARRRRCGRRALDAAGVAGEAAQPGLSAPGRLELVTEELPEVPEGGLLLHTVATGLSAGTELAFVKGDHPALRSTFDPELGPVPRPAPTRRTR